MIRPALKRGQKFPCRVMKDDYAVAGGTVLHRFRSRIRALSSNDDGRILVLTDAGIYVSDKKLKRWRKIKV